MINCVFLFDQSLICKCIVVGGMVIRLLLGWPSSTNKCYCPQKVAHMYNNITRITPTLVYCSSFPFQLTLQRSWHSVNGFDFGVQVMEAMVTVLV